MLHEVRIPVDGQHDTHWRRNTLEPLPPKKPNNTTDVKDPKHIMRAVDLLQAAKVKDPLPRWLVPLDYALACLYLASFFGVCIYLLHKLFTWL